ncbi:MAG: hypothetical protein KJ067_24765 [Vicinamibacteria bacterium]|nr:hypothetical protein [Vicinamibacteria bacterium]
MRPATTAEDRAAFAALQSKLRAQWQAIATHSDDEQCVVVVPSLSMDLDVPPTVLQAYEERFLFLLFLLRLPRMRVVYVTSQPVLPETVEYFLGLLAGVIPGHARARLHLVSVGDGTSRPLSLKLLERPRLLARVRALVPNPDTAHLVPFNTTELEEELALRLGVPMYGAEARFAPWGTKNGGRRLFAEEGVPHPLGRSGVRGAAGAAQALCEMRRERADMREALLKLDEGVSGMGNALVDLRDLPPPGDAAERPAVESRLRALRVELEGQSAEQYLAAFAAQGGVVEERIAGDEFRSPSVQLRATPAGAVEVLSTHDQLLGGPSGMSFLGSLFPADPGYAVEITRHARKVGERLAREGVLGRFALDFVAVRDAGGPWRCYAIEINLRKGGTTAPYLTLEFLTRGRYVEDRGAFEARGGRAKFYVSSDHAEHDAYRQLAPMDLFDVAMREGVHWSPATETGVVFHMLAALTERGRFGLTAIADSPADARALYDRTLAAVDRKAVER